LGFAHAVTIPLNCGHATSAWNDVPTPREEGSQVLVVGFRV
jgi:hypothetical protein